MQHNHSLLIPAIYLNRDSRNPTLSLGAIILSDQIFLFAKCFSCNLGYRQPIIVFEGSRMTTRVGGIHCLVLSDHFLNLKL